MKALITLRLKMSKTEEIERLKIRVEELEKELQACKSKTTVAEPVAEIKTEETVTQTETKETASHETQPVAESTETVDTEQT